MQNSIWLKFAQYGLINFVWNYTEMVHTIKKYRQNEVYGSGLKSPLTQTTLRLALVPNEIEYLIFR